MDPTLAKKKERLRHVESLLEHEGYEILTAELERQKQAGIEKACNVTLPQAERDAGAGMKTLAEQLLEFLPNLRKSLEATLNPRKKRGSWRNS